MTFKSKRGIANIASGIILSISYIVYALSDHAPSLNDVAKWAHVILIFIGIGIVVTIIIQILFHISYSTLVAVREQKKDDKEIERIIASEVMEDEFDKRVSQKSARITSAFVGIGFIIFLVSLAFFDTSIVVALHILLASVFLGNCIEECVSVFFYERGI